MLCPVNVRKNWDGEYDKWAPDVPVYSLGEEGANAMQKRAEILQEWESVEGGGVLLVGYDTFRSLVKGSYMRKVEHRDLFKKCLLEV